MKKIYITFLAIAFGTGVAFAQTTPQDDFAPADESVHELTFDRMSNRPDEEEEEELNTISIYELPESVLEQLKYSELGGHTIISIIEVHARSASDAPLQYELVLQERESADPAEPTLVVRYDQFGELLSQKKEEAPVALKKRK